MRIIWTETVQNGSVAVPFMSTESEVPPTGRPCAERQFVMVVAELKADEWSVVLGLAWYP